MKLENLIKTGIVLAGIALSSKAVTSPITFWTHPNAQGEEIIFICKGDTSMKHVTADGFVESNTEAVGANVGDTILIKGTNRVNCYEVKSTTNHNFPADGCFTRPDNRDISIHLITNELGVPDTMIDLYAWVNPSTIDSTKVGRGFLHNTSHKGYIQLTDTPGNNGVKFCAKLVRNDTTFQKLDSFKFTPYDGNSKLIDSIGLDTIPPTSVKEYEIMRNRVKIQPSIYNSQDLIGKEVYDLSGRRVKGNLKQGIYFVKDERRLLLVK